MNTTEQLRRIMQWGEHPTESTLPSWALKGLAPDPDCPHCGALLRSDGACPIDCEGS